MRFGKLVRVAFGIPLIFSDRTISVQDPHALDRTCVTVFLESTCGGDVAPPEVMSPVPLRAVATWSDRLSCSSSSSLPEPIDLRMREADAVEGGV